MPDDSMQLFHDAERETQAVEQDLSKTDAQCCEKGYFETLVPDDCVFPQGLSGVLRYLKLCCRNPK
jgi:hypothetical protein